MNRTGFATAAACTSLATIFSKLRTARLQLICLFEASKRLRLRLRKGAGKVPGSSTASGGSSDTSRPLSKGHVLRLLRRSLLALDFVTSHAKSKHSEGHERKIKDYARH